MSERMMTWSYLCDTCRHCEYIASTTRVRCGAMSGAITKRRAINGEQRAEDVCFGYEERKER